MKKIIRNIILAVVTVVVVVVLAFAGLYSTRIQTISSIEQVTDYEDGYNLYTMNIAYDYSLDDIIGYGIVDDQTMIDAILKEALPLLPVHIKAPSFGCTAFTVQDAEHVHMGRNYDFKNDTSSMLVYCSPRDGYRSMAFAALDNVSANTPDANIRQQFASLTAPFICLDGMNEKGVSIAVLTLDSDPTYQDTDKPMIATTLAIRLVLDRAATTQEAVDLLREYDMFASSGRDYHFYITDAQGDGRVIEYDPEQEDRPLVDTPSEAVTNFYIPSRGLIGYRNQFLTDTKGNGIMNNVFLGYEPYKGDIAYRKTGSLISFETGTAVAYGLFGAQDRGTLFIKTGDDVYQGMIIGQAGKAEDVEINVCKTKHLTNTRTSASDEALRLVPPRIMSLEQAIEYVDTDELLEVTPKNLRLRKKILDPRLRKRAGFKQNQ